MTNLTWQIWVHIMLWFYSSDLMFGPPCVGADSGIYNGSIVEESKENVFWAHFTVTFHSFIHDFSKFSFQSNEKYHKKMNSLKFALGT